MIIMSNHDKNKETKRSADPVEASDPKPRKNDEEQSK